jgi:hypothetical protein
MLKLKVFKRARTTYLEAQAKLQREIAQKKSEKESTKLIEEMIWGAPLGSMLLCSGGRWYDRS